MMTSKKDLEHLKQRIICAKGEEEFNLFYKKYYKEIKKDIEVLEILRKYYISDGWSNGGVIEFWAMPEAQLKKVKEYFENGK